MTTGEEAVDHARRLVDEADALAYVDPRRGLELAVAAAAVARPDQRATALLSASRCAANTEDAPASARLAEEGLRALDADPTGDDPGVRARLLARLAEAAVRVGDLTTAHRRAVAALDLAETATDPCAAGEGLWALGNTCFFLGDYGAAQRLFEAGRETFTRAGWAVGVACLTGNLGEALVRRGDVRAGEAALRHSLEQLRPIAPITLPRALLMLAEAVSALGDPAAALALQDEALAEAVAQGRTDMEGLAYASRGWTLAAAGRHRDARAAFAVGLELAQAMSFREAELEALLGLGTTETRLGALERAAGLLEEAGLLAATSHQRVALGRAHRLLADVYEGQGAIERAYGHLRASIAVTEVAPGQAFEPDAPSPDEILARWEEPTGRPGTE